MSAAVYVGRVGALAVALGIGAAVAGVPGLAWADPEPGSDPTDSPGTSQGPSTDPGDTAEAGDKDLGAGGDSSEPGDPGDADGAGGITGGMKVDSSGGALTSTHGKAGAKSSSSKDRVTDQPKRRSLIKPKNISAPASAPKTAAQSVDDQQGRRAQVRVSPAGVAPSKAPAAPQLKQSSPPVVDVTPVIRKPATSSPVTAAAISAAPKPAASKVVSRLLSLATLSAPTAGDTTPVSTDSPLFAAFFAVGRQVSQKAAVEDESMARSVDSTQTSLMTAPANSLSLVRATRLSISRDTTKPTVSLAAPSNGAPVSGTVTLSATASDNVGVASVKFYVDDGTTAVGTDTTSPYSALWNTTTLTDGAHTVKAVASDAAGNTATSTRTVTVDNTKPTVTLAAPNNGAPVSGTVTLSATASDNVGVANVKFYVDNSTTAVGTDTTSPYSASWNTTTLTDGAHTVKAVASDAAGNTATSTMNVIVDNRASTIPVTVTSIPVNTYPTAVAFSGNNAFVYGGDVIWTIDTRTNRITDSTALYNEPPVVSPDGKRRYEAGYMSVNVIDNQTNAVIDTIELPNCDECGYGYSAGVQELVISPDGTRVYARHAYPVDDAAIPSAVTVIDTSSNEVIGTTGPIYAKDIEVALDGTVYAIDEDYYYADVNVYDKDMRYLKSIRLSSYTGSPWSTPTTFAISTDRKYAFAHVYDGDTGAMTVSIIDIDPASPTYQTETFMTERYSAVSPDGTRLYVPESDGKTITVYDTATNAKVGSFVTDQQANTGPRGVYFAPNGTLYVADPGDNTLYAVTIEGTTAS